MALLITPTQGVFMTTHQLATPQAYVRITSLDWDRKTNTVNIRFNYFSSEAAAKSINQPEPFVLAGFPASYSSTTPMDVLASPGGSFAAAYGEVKTILSTFLDAGGTVTDV